MVIRISLLHIFSIIKENDYLIFMVGLAVFIFVASLLYYLYLSKGLKEFTKVLSSAFEEQEVIESRLLIINKSMEKSSLIPRTIKKTWDRYFTDYNTNRSETILDPFEYFDENQIVLRSGFRKVIEAIPAIFVSLGILGTFWGITTGISDINSDAGVEGLQRGINTLLFSMRFAFYSSIAGIVISLLYQLFDRLFLYQILINRTDQLFNEIEKVIPIESESSYLNKIVTTQENQLQDMRTFFSDEFIPRLTKGISDTVSQSLEPHLEKSNDIMESVVRNTTEAQSDSLNVMVDSFIESLNEVTGDHIENLGDALHKTVEWQEKVHNEMSDLVEELSHVAEKQSEMAKNTTELSQEMNEYTHTLSDYQEGLAKSTSDLNSITENNTELLGQMEMIYSEMMKRKEQEEDSFSQRIERMNRTVERITELGSAFLDLQEETKISTETLIDATDSMTNNVENNKDLNKSLLEQHEVSNEWSVKTHELLEDVAHNSSISEAIQRTLDDLYGKISEERYSLDAKQSEYNTLITNSTDSLMEYWNENSNFLHENKDQFTELNNALSESMNDFADHMHRGVQGTFEQFDVELNKAVNSLARGVSSIETVVESIEHDMDSVNGQISSFNQSMEKLITGVKI